MIENQSEDTIIHEIRDPAVFAYIRGILEWPDAMSRALRHIPLEMGIVFSFLPFPLEDASTGYFRAINERLKTRGDGISRGRTLRFVAKYLNNRPSGIGLFASVNYSDDAVVARRVTPYVLVDSESSSRKFLWQFVTKEHARIDSIKTAFNEARPFPFLDVLTSIRSDGEPLRKAEVLDNQAVSDLAKRTEYLIFEVFDGLAYGIWANLGRVRRRSN